MVEHVYVNRGPSGLGLFLGLVLIVLIVVGVLWGTGALTVRHDAQDRVQITLDPQRVEHAGDDALERTGKALEHTGERIERQAHKPDRQQPAQR